MTDKQPYHVRLTVNGIDYERQVESRVLLSDFVRHKLLLHGTHVGCEHGVCGACTVQADGHEIVTVEGIAPAADRLDSLQQALHETHGLQCGYCTPGILTTTKVFLDDNPAPARMRYLKRFQAICAAAEGVMLAAARMNGRDK